MGLEDLEEKIREDGEKQIKEINEEAEEEIQKIKKKINKEAEKEAQKVLDEGKREGELTYRRKIADAVIESKDQIEAEKNKQIEDVFKKAREKILNMDDSEKKEILQGLIQADEDKVRNPEILVDEKYAHLIDGAKAADLEDFGVIIQSEDGQMKIDNTLSSRIERLKTTLKPEIASILFPENG